MQLTKGQKDALVRKVMAIIDAKKEAKREELRKSYKPSKKASELITKIEKLLKARAQFYKTIDELGFRVNYTCIYTNNDCEFSFELQFNKKDAKLSDYADKIRDKELGKIYNKEFKYPVECDVIDDIELMSLSKSFNVDEFLKKYEDL